MKFFIGGFIVIALSTVALAYVADKAVHPPCTCGPTCPTPTTKPWPIPASMEKVR